MLISGIVDEDKKWLRLLVEFERSVTGQAIHEQGKYMQEIAGHLTAGVADKEMETDKTDPAAQNSLNGERLEVETESQWQRFRSRMVEHVQSLSATLLALTALGLLGLFFFVVRVTSVFSGGRNSVNRRRRK